MRYELNAEQRTTYRRYAGLALPRHTSYPIVPVWRRDYDADHFRDDLAVTCRESRPLSLYVHVPFCQKLCYYCACTKEIVPAERRARNDPANELLSGLALEAATLHELVGDNSVHQFHLGGGSPTFLDVAQLQRLWDVVTRHFRFAPDVEIAIEIDPRITTREQLAFLAQAGFNRVSLGVQDFDPRVQKAVNRIQPVEMVERCVTWCREFGISSVNFDLIYGLPFQTLETMEATLEQVIRLMPDRIAFYRLAVIPDIFRWQNTFCRGDLPRREASLELNLLAIDRFLEAGYRFIGLDHFARPGEALDAAAAEDSLHRTFQGMTTGKGLDLIGMGPSAISMLDHACAQNHKTTETWREAVGVDLATERGLSLTLEDRLRREVLQQLYGHGVVHKDAIASRFAIDFDEHFDSELAQLNELAEDGLVELDAASIRLTTPLGRLLVRVVGAVFDAYLPRNCYRDGLPTNLASQVG
jgi:oxygen-independent coproporphyrinogen-3 oxidase